MSPMIEVAILSALAGCLIGLISAWSAWVNKKPDGYFFVNFNNPEDDMFKMQIDIPLEKLPDSKYLIFKVKKIQ